MAIVPTWEEIGVDGSLWDDMILGEDLLPGNWSVRCVSAKVLDVKPRRGADGARVRDRGIMPTHLTITGELLPEEWDAFSPILKRIKPRAGQARGPLTIVHPAAEAHDVTAIEIESIEGPEIHDGIGEVHIYALEWVPLPKKRKAQPDPAEVAPIYVSAGGIQRPNNSPWYSAQPPSIETDLNSLPGVSPDFLQFIP